MTRVLDNSGSQLFHVIMYCILYSHYLPTLNIDLPDQLTVRDSETVGEYAVEWQGAVPLCITSWHQMYITVHTCTPQCSKLHRFAQSRVGCWPVSRFAGGDWYDFTWSWAACEAALQVPMRNIDRQGRAGKSACNFYYCICIQFSSLENAIRNGGQT